ncbi:30S ribosomal protein S12 methylthiotransferase RimO [Sulfurospirillum barnesii]|uniref:Ribosomal protein uS12 methylthiotransferase RimO n=1 Tax=Sulfurospirillum barnesii (strain ATCC 700032 / DSM 10660 / SES-3) TaxID=760154 RepID=I3XV24_SULBS|nr:30S ribosomal protein S12 methylthiotransferase RimO [Sulfurospirillum barnesii]AFL67798.1 SSU ribosomal protein S12P methylthiotransferase [Sulfurospirillum barnesii SES-3]
MKKLHLVSLGCNKNLVDSEVMLGKLRAYEMCDDASQADVLIVNTCGFIGPAKEESLNTIFSLHEARKKGSLLVMAGCLSERYKEDLTKELKEVDLFTGVGDYDKIDEIIALRQNRFTPATYLMNEEERVITGSNAHAYVKLSEGCNQACSFCAIPGFKGKLHSRTLDSLVKEVKILVSKGFFDFSFISQDSSSYLRDMGEKEGLIALIDAVEKIEGVKSARILYLYPTTTSNALIERIIASPLFHNYFDMPIQHISDAMLKRMKRGAGRERIIEQLELMRQAPNSFIRTSFIVGHPGESEAEFEELLEFTKHFDFDRVNIFAYSDEEDTSAYEMSEKIETKIINKRIKALDKIVQAKTKKSFEKEVGKEVVLLIEGESSEHELFMGARELLWAPQIDGEILVNDSDVENVRIGTCYKATITECVGDKLIATITALA